MDLPVENYDAAVEFLKKTLFVKKQNIISTHMIALLKPNEYSNNSTDQLRKIYDKIDVHVKGLVITLRMSKE